jgi:hypothetical protein
MQSVRGRFLALSPQIESWLETHLQIGILPNSGPHRLVHHSAWEDPAQLAAAKGLKANPILHIDEQGQIPPAARPGIQAKRRSSQCGNGTIAFETARQLQAPGQWVAPLAAIEPTATPGRRVANATGHPMCQHAADAPQKVGGLEVQAGPRCSVLCASGSAGTARDRHGRPSRAKGPRATNPQRSIGRSGSRCPADPPAMAD